MRIKRDRNIAKNLLRQSTVGDLVDSAAADVAGDVKRFGGEVSDSYADSVAVKSGQDRTRHYARVTVDHPGWIAIEWGTRKTPAHAPLRRALEKSGLPNQFKGRK
jgi:hypothetical protein